MSVPRVFEDAGRIFRADTCEPLKAAIKREDVGFQGWARGNYPGTLLPPRVLPGICSVGVWDARAQQSWGLGEHCNEGLEITYLSRGSLAFSADDRDYILRDGDVTVTRPWQIHEVGDPFISASRLGWIIIDLNVRRPNQDWRWPDWILLSEAERRRLAHIIQNTDQTMWNGAELAAHFERLIGLLSEADPARAETETKLAVNSILVSLLKTLDLGDDSAEVIAGMNDEKQKPRCPRPDPPMAGTRLGHLDTKAFRLQNSGNPLPHQRISTEDDDPEPLVLLHETLLNIRRTAIFCFPPSAASIP